MLDPAVGTARFLIAAMSRMVSQAAGTPDPTATVESIKQRQLLGSDLDGWVSTIAKMNMFIHGDGKSNMVNGNGLVLGDRALFAAHPGGIDRSVDVVLTNPPLGDTSFVVAQAEWISRSTSVVAPGAQHDYLAGLGVVPLVVKERRQLDTVLERLAGLEQEISAVEQEEKSSARDRRLKSLRKRRDAADLRRRDLKHKIETGDTTRSAAGEVLKGGALFLGAIGNYLRPVRDPALGVEWQGGRAVVVVDEAILNTADYAPTRRFIRERFFVKAVVSLGRPAFKYLAHTDAKTSVLFLVRKPSDALVQREPVYYDHAERVGYSATGRWIGSDLPEVLDDYGRFKNAVSAGYHGPVYEPDAALSAVRSLPGHGRSWHADDIGTEGDRLDFYNARSKDLTTELRGSTVPPVRLGELVEIRPRTAPDESRTGEYEFAQVERNFASVKHKGSQQVGYSPKDLWTVRDRDIVVSGIDLVHGAVAVATTAVEGFVMSKEMYPYRVRDESVVLPEYVALLLRSPFARELIFGMVTGTSNRTRLDSPEQLLGLEVPTPPPVGQQRAAVADRLEADRLRQEARRALVRAEDAAVLLWPGDRLVASIDEQYQDLDASVTADS